MWIFLLLPFLCSLSIAERITHQRYATADNFKLQCESMLFRTYAEGSICYFAVNDKVTQDRGDRVCRNEFRGAKMLLERARERVLTILKLDPSEYHDVRSSGEKSVLCAYDAEYSCENGGDLTLPGRCVMRSDKPITWKQAENFCKSKGASGVVIHNEAENLAVSGLLWKDEAGWLLPSRGDTWSAEEQTIDYWKWFFERFTPDSLKCSDDEQHAIIANNAKDSCAANGQWKVDHSTNKNIALCMRDASCPFCPPPKKSDDPEPGQVTMPEIDEPTTTKTTVYVPTTTPAPCYPLNDPPYPHHLWDLRYFYNAWRILHAFAANDEGIRAIMVNGIGYDRWANSGSLGATLSDAGYAKLHEFCSDPVQKKKIVQMSFHKQGVSYHHYFGRIHIPFEIYVGYVATAGGVCGSKWPVRRWGCMVSADAMYAGDLNGNTWYRGRASGVHFWLWDMNAGANNAARKGKPASCVDPPKTNPVKKPTTAPPKIAKNGPPKDQHMWALSFWYNWARILHGFAATNAGYKTMQSNGIGYDGWNGHAVLGGTLSDAGYAKLSEFCDDPEQTQHIKKMWFTKSGLAYYHTFEPKEIYVGYVSLKQGACGATKAMRRYTCLVSADSMYAESLESNTWYRGRAQEGGKVYFWLWQTGKGGIGLD